jgi:DNA replication protein DnaC
MSLTLGPWERSGHAVLITGPTGAGKSWLGCALAQHACRQGRSAFYQRVPRLAEELRIRHANGTFTRWLDILQNTDVLVLDDWGLVGMDAQTRTDLLEMIDDRAGRKATVTTSQLPIEHWHEWIGDATVADAMLGPDHAKPPPTDPDGRVAAQGQTESKEGGKPGLKTTAS